MKVVRLLLLSLLVITGAFSLFLLYASVSDYRPESVTSCPVEGEPAVLDENATLELVIWNLGYAGLDASMDFFYDGGDRVRPSEEGVNSNLLDIRREMASFRGADFILLQEVDRHSKRSYYRNQVEAIQSDFKGYQGFFGKNYDVSFVPLPVTEPMGKVESGLYTLTRHTPAHVSRHSFPGNYAWPYRLFMLDRCFLVSRHPVSDGRELLVINTHNSAYDDGSLRKQQMEHLREFLREEYRAGNYVIVGGDWNQTPNGFDLELPGHPYDTINLSFVEPDYPEAGWTWAYDPGTPTNRRVSTPYNPSTSLTTVIDYFLLSPRVSLVEVETIDLGFRSSDHQPVRLRIRLGSGIDS